MDTQLSPGDYGLLDEENTSIIPETPNSIGQSLIRRLGLAEAEAASTFINNTNFVSSCIENGNFTLLCLVKFYPFSVEGLLVKKKKKKTCTAQKLTTIALV